MGARIEMFRYAADCHVKLGVPWQVLDSKIIDAQKIVPMIDHFVSLITESVLILIT